MSGQVTTRTADLAQHNLQTHIASNPYPGRGLVVGPAEAGGFNIVYWIMGRSAHSRNRRFVVDGSTLRTEPVDASQVKDPSLIIYAAMLELPGIQLVSNGDQTQTAYDVLSQGGQFVDAMATREREPDAPNYTPRISAMLDFRSPAPTLQLSLLKANPFDGEKTDRVLFAPALPPAGFGVGLTTYMSDGSPLPSYSGDPLVLPLTGSAEALLDRYYDALNADNRVAVAVKHVNADGACGQLLVRNRFA